MFKKLEFDIPEGQYEIGKITDDYNALIIELNLDEKTFEFSVEEKVILTLINESVATDDTYQNCDMNWPVYEATEGTDLLNFFYSQTGEVYKDWGYKHIRFLGQEEIVDIITTDSPELI